MSSSKTSPKLFLISGPSGVGKNTIIDGTKKIIPQLEETISCTTRKQRAHEKEGKHYYFLSKKKFEEKIKNNEFLEYFEVHGMYYGTLKSEIERITKKGNIPLAVIDVQGALYVKKHYPKTVLIFIKPDSWKVIEERLRARNLAPEEFKLRLKNAKKELMQAKFYDYQVINHTGQVERTVKEVAKVIRKEDEIDK